MVRQVEQNPYAPPADDAPPDVPENRVAPARAELIRQRIARLNRNSLQLGGAGFLLQAMGRNVSGLGGSMVVLVGSAAFVTGLVLYAQMRGRSGWWGLLGLLSCVGLLVLLVLPKYCHHCGRVAKGSECSHCGAPAPK